MNDYRANFDVMFSNMLTTMIDSTKKAVEESHRWQTVSDISEKEKQLVIKTAC